MGTIALLIMALAAQTAPAPPSGPPPATLCHTAQHGQFDFWVGQWDVYRADTNQLVAHSLIEKLYNGCAVRENWMPLGGTGGGSLNSLSAGQQAMGAILDRFRQQPERLHRRPAGFENGPDRRQSFRQWGG